MKATRLLAGVSAIALITALGVTTASAQQVQVQVQKQIQYSNQLGVRLLEQSRYSSDFRVVGDIQIRGRIEVDALAGALIDDKQLITGNSFENSSNSDYSASFSDSVIDDTSGNVGVNFALGINNVQANEVAIAALTVGNDASLKASIVNLQDVGNNTNNGYYATANLATTDNVVEDIEGNVGVNIALGEFNAQKNNLAIATASGADNLLAQANVGSLQHAQGNTTTVEVANYQFSGAGLVENVTGNAGLNIALGTGNLQSNSLSIASVQ